VIECSLHTLEAPTPNGPGSPIIPRLRLQSIVSYLLNPTKRDFLLLSFFGRCWRGHPASFHLADTRDGSRGGPRTGNAKE